MRTIIAIIFLWATIPATLVAQVDSTATDSLQLNAPAVADTTGTPEPASAAPDTLKQDSAAVLFEVHPWEYPKPLSAKVTATDSTLRWQLWPDYTYKLNREPGVISYRMGTIGRTNAQQIGAQEPKYQQLYWEDIPLTDPVSGITNWSYIPHHKVNRLFVNDYGLTHRTTFSLREYYLNEPLTQLNYTESSFDTRSLEFAISRNFSQRLNTEISYWDRRDGGEYPNSGTVGRQIYARATYQLDERQKVNLHILNNNYDNELPFGYVIPNPARYNFDRFDAIAQEPNASADQASTVISLGYYRRPADSTRHANKLQAGLFLNTNKRNTIYSADTTAYSARSIGASINKRQKVGPFRLQGKAMVRQFSNTESSNTLNLDNWSMINAEGQATVTPISRLMFGGHTHFRRRSDGYSDYQLGANVEMTLLPALRLNGSVATGSRMPTPQQLYWQSSTFSGNENLEEETIQAYSAGLELQPYAGTTVGLESQLKQIEQGHIIGADSTFANANPYSALSTAAYATFNSTHFELSTSATYHQFGSFIKSYEQPIPMTETRQLWFKASAYVKGYLFNRATYVKAGLAGVLSPQNYQSAQYFPSLDYWQTAGNDDAFIPSYNRLDIDFSARLRSIMVLLRYENVLDELVQQGYFETANYPMTRRRFMFGVRVLLRN